MNEPQAANASAAHALVAARVRAIPLAVDLGRYELAQAVFAARLRIDYRSLLGGEAQELDAATLLAAWQALVPGFDATLHEIGSVAVRLDGAQAQASADVVASHWLDDGLWRLTGRYDWTLQRQEGEWRVTGMSLALREEQGDRGLCAQAQARVAARAGARA